MIDAQRFVFLYHHLLLSVTAARLKYDMCGLRCDQKTNYRMLTSNLFIAGLWIWINNI